MPIYIKLANEQRSTIKNSGNSMSGTNFETMKLQDYHADKLFVSHNS